MRFTRFLREIASRRKQKMQAAALLEEREPIESLNTRQLRSIKKIIEHAYENVPFYRRKYDLAGFKPSDIRTIEDISKIPFTTKDELRLGFPDDVKAKNIQSTRMLKKMTSGSTGMPFAFYEDAAAEEGERKFLFRMHHAMGLGPSDKIVRMRSRDIEVHGIRGMIRKAFGRTKHISTKDMSVSNMEDYARFIRSHRPKVIESFPHHILALASYMDGKGMSIHVPIIHLVGGNVTDLQRSRLEKVFRSRIYNDYGSAECYGIACQCERMEKYHIDMTRYHVEIVTQGRQARVGEIGEIVVTNLTNYVMPFIRYRLLDAGILGEPCSCGRSFPVLDNVIGRVRQLIELPDGKLLDPNQFNKKVIVFYEEIEHFQAVLGGDNTLELKVVLAPGARNDIDSRLQRSLDELLEGRLRIVIRHVDSIERYGAEKKEMTTFMQVPPDLMKVR